MSAGTGGSWRGGGVCPVRRTCPACSPHVLGLFAARACPVRRTRPACPPHLLDVCKGITPPVRRVRLCPFMSVYGKLLRQTGAEGGGIAQKIADEQHLPPGEAAVAALVAALRQGFCQGVAAGYPVREAAHGGFGRGMWKVV